MFFDALRLRWSYEPEGFALNDENYLPDFWLPEQEIWFEVKPTTPSEHEQALMQALLNATQARAGYIAFGPLPDPTSEVQIPSQSMSAYAFWPATEGSVGGYDCPYVWSACPRCGRLDLEFDGRGARVCGYKCCPTDNKGYTFDEPRILSAYERARSMQFWQPNQREARPWR